MPTEVTVPAQTTDKRSLSWSQVLLIVLATILVTAGVTYWVLATGVFVKEFKPVELSAREERVLNDKLKAIGYEVGELDDQGRLKPEPYSEVGANREVSFSERELNAMLAKNTDLARKLAIDLSDDLVSARLLIPLEPDFPVLGGKTLRVNAGVEMAYREGRPIVVLKGVSIMGVPIPQCLAWQPEKCRSGESVRWHSGILEKLLGGRGEHPRRAGADEDQAEGVNTSRAGVTGMLGAGESRPTPREPGAIPRTVPGDTSSRPDGRRQRGPIPGSTLIGPVETRGGTRSRFPVASRSPGVAGA